MHSGDGGGGGGRAFSNMLEYTHSWEETKGQESSLNLNPIIHLI